MQHISFPGLGLGFDVNPIAFQLGDVAIKWYAILIVIGFGLGIFFLEKEDSRYHIGFMQILPMILLILPVSIICARLYYVIFSFENYSNNLLEIFNIRDGGLAIYGGVIGAIITIFTYCKVKKLHFLDVLDYIAPFLPLGQAIGRWGNFFNVEAYGTETNNFLRMGITKEGRYMEVHPTFLYESVATFTIFIILFCMRKNRKYSGQITCWYFFLYGIIRAIIEGFRTDSLMVGNIRVSQILSIVMAAIAGVILIVKKVRKDEN